jgi:UDP-glucose 4-epimerase
VKVFVTGGAGFIGSAVTAELIAQGHELTVFDSLVTGHREAVPQEARFIQGDLLDEDALRMVLEGQGFDAIFHFAAFIEAGESMRYPGKYFRNNLLASFQLIEAAQKAGIEKFVFSSTAAIFKTSDEPLTEESPFGPQNTYGQTKLMSEHILSQYNQIHGLRYATLRYFNAAGSLPDRGEAHQPESHLIPLTLQVALGQRESISIFGTDYTTPDGTCIRDYVHIADLVSAHVLALHGLADTSKLAYNLGSGRGYSVREVIDTVRKITGHAVPAIEAPRRPGDPARLVASPARIQSELSWQPEHSSLEEIVASAWEWALNHPHGYTK